ncbi:MAG: hypothetical protein DHS20C17_25350 [Cyclobacteriaceae bacterium]|nr:MAG: hypothetical protein DHS20C17_25350 [Cyclobacteriaceae bacterium]
MKKLIIILIISLVGTGVFAQEQAKEKIESARIGFITERLGLTPDQAERFWPLYNEYRLKNQDAANKFRQYRAGLNPDAVTDEESKRVVEMELELKQHRLDLEREYSKRMLDVISTQQVASLRKAERDFRGILLRRLQEARQQKLRQHQRFQNRDQVRDQIRDRYRD